MLAAARSVGSAALVVVLAALAQRTAGQTTVDSGACDDVDGSGGYAVAASVTEIGFVGDGWAFTGCTNLTTVTFAADATLATIHRYAFSGSGLTSIAVPASVTNRAASKP